MKILILLLLSSIAWTFQLSPMSQSIDLQKSSSAIYRISNESNEPMAIEINVANRVMDEKGKENHKLDEKSFVITPQQYILRAKEKNVPIKVSYVGDKKIDFEKSYRLIVEQLPIELDQKKKKANIKVLLKYVASLYVNQNEFQSKVEVVHFKREKNKLNLEVSNVGQKHQVLYDLKIKIYSGDNITELSGKQVDGIRGENILAKSKRIFEIDIPTKIQKIDRVEFEYSES